MNTKHSQRLICVSCGHDAYLEPNYDESYIMCMYCHREYKGGINELFELNSMVMNSKSQVESEIKDKSKMNLRESLKMN